MLLATIDLEQGPIAISNELNRASEKEIAAWEFAKRTLLELFLVAPNDITESTDKDGRSLWVYGKQVFALRAARFPEKVVVTGEWLVSVDSFDRNHWSCGYFADEVD